jgi:hypothetical protein
MAGPEATRYAFWYPAVQGAVTERASTADVFAAVRSALADQGITEPPGLFKAVNELRSIAVAQRNYAQALQKAPNDAPILGTQVPTALWAREPDAMRINPLLQVNYQVTTRDQEGNLVSRWLTSFGVPFQEGLTKDDLSAMVALDAEASASSYGSELEGDPVIGAVLAY